MKNKGLFGVIGFVVSVAVVSVAISAGYLYTTSDTRTAAKLGFPDVQTMYQARQHGIKTAAAWKTYQKAQKLGFDDPQSMEEALKAGYQHGAPWKKHQEYLKKKAEWQQASQDFKQAQHFGLRSRSLVCDDFIGVVHIKQLNSINPKLAKMDPPDGCQFAPDSFRPNHISDGPMQGIVHVFTSSGYDGFTLRKNVVQRVDGWDPKKEFGIDVSNGMPTLQQFAGSDTKPLSEQAAQPASKAEGNTAAHGAASSPTSAPAGLPTYTGGKVLAFQDFPLFGKPHAAADYVMYLQQAAEFCQHQSAQRGGASADNPKPCDGTEQYVKPAIEMVQQKLLSLIHHDFKGSTLQQEEKNWNTYLQATLDESQTIQKDVLDINMDKNVQKGIGHGVNMFLSGLAGKDPVKDALQSSHLSVLYTMYLEAAKQSG